ncbi:hypothetical protein AVEN_38298-1 [Araneus ventricosus]|uniref:Uncharacterized protein n=1 Tax=Araneus ventricosus TaxID=182803 RepID=A0A4Y2UCI1_ARAVE|nr:hypothetical protein AVEN_38298-1 [Araneus ventricosus]
MDGGIVRRENRLYQESSTDDVIDGVELFEEQWDILEQRAEIVALSVTTCTCPECLKVPPHNADITGIWCTVRETALLKLLSSCDKFVKHAPLLHFELIWRNPS